MDATTIWGITGLVTFAASVLVAGVLYVRQKREPRLFAYTESGTLIERGDSSDIEVRFRGTPVARVVHTKIVVWNRGRGALRGEDIPALDPLRVRIPEDCDILDVVAASTTPANEVSAAPDEDDTDIRLDLRYLDPGQEVILGITHTGSQSQPFHVDGAVIGVGNVRPSRANRRDIRTNWFLGVLAVTSALFFLLGLLSDSGDSPERSTSWVLTAIGGIVLTAVVFGLAWWISGRAARRSVPPALR